MQALWILLVAVLWAAPAAAGITTITISQKARLEAGQLVVALTVGNEGDEAALAVRPVLRFGGAEARGKGAPRLDPTDLHEETLSLPAGALGEGRWPYEIAVDYTDANQYPFQALQVQALVVGSPPPAKVVVPAIEGGELAGEGALAVTVKNLTPEARTARVRVRLPDGVEAANAVREERLDAWQELRLEVPLTNRSGLLGSRYPVFVVVEYDDGAIHQAVVSQGTVAIVGVGSFLDRHGRWLTAAAGVLFALWLAYLASRALQRGPATPGG